MEQICEKVARGVPQQTAAIAAGVPKRTFQGWLERGRREDAKEPYRSLAQKLEEALAVYHESRVVLVQEGATKDPRLAQWELERRFRDDWGETRRVDTTMTVQARPFVDVSKLTLDEQRTLLELLRKGSPEQEQLPQDGTPAMLMLEAGEDAA